MSDFDPLTFERLSVLRMSDAKTSGELLDRLVAMVESLCVDMLAQPGLTPLQIAGVQRTRARVPGAIQVYRRWVSLFGWSEDQSENALFLLATMADNLLCLGALAMRNPRSAALVESIVSGGQKGGKKTGQKRRTKADAWKAIVKAEIIRIRSEQPGLSQDKLADAILYAWKDDKPPGHQSITKHISALDRARRTLGNEGASDR